MQRFGRFGKAALTAAQSLISKPFLASTHLPPYDMGSGAAPIVVCTVLDLQTQVRDVSLTNPGGVRR
ncbi:MAG: hypothetical protein EKK33_03495 [Bradyrhizobiaceae bacterium]|nr:MAG: hypothetical protein EKK33_03495 [Bradyrhizobiaceae bacterium]